MYKGLDYEENISTRLHSTPSTSYTAYTERRGVFSLFQTFIEQNYSKNLYMYNKM